jgi:hypothetical protein
MLSQLGSSRLGQSVDTTQGSSAVGVSLGSPSNGSRIDVTQNNDINSRLAVPIIEFTCRYIPGNTIVSMEDVQRECHAAALQQLAEDDRGFAATNRVGLFSQVRLHRREDM